MPRAKKLDKADLLSKAIAAIRRNGYRETSLEDLAKEFNFTKPALYYYVDSKEALLFEIYEKTIDEWLGLIQGIATDHSRTPVEKICDVIRRFTHLCIEHDEMAIFFSEKAYLSDEHFEAISDKERKVIEIIAGIIQEGIDTGAIRPTPATVAAYALVGMTAWSYRWVSADGPLDIDDIADLYCRLLTQGLTR